MQTRELDRLYHFCCEMRRIIAASPVPSVCIGVGIEVTPKMKKYIHEPFSLLGTHMERFMLKINGLDKCGVLIFF